MKLVWATLISVAALLAFTPVAAAASQGPWVLPASDISATGQRAVEVRIAIAPDGTATVVWRQGNAGDQTIQAATRSPGGSFGAAVDLSAVGRGASSTLIAVAPDGTATAAWRIRDDDANWIIQAATRPPGGSFGAAVDLSAPSRGVQTPGIAIAPDGTAMVVWSRVNSTNWGVQAAIRPPGGSFGAPVDLSPPGQGAFTPQIAIAPDGTATAVWMGYSGTNFIIQSAIRPPGGSFGAPVDLSTPGRGDGEAPGIAIAPDGIATVVWRQYSGANWIIQAATRPPGGSFGTRVDLSAGGQGVYASDPMIAIAPDGTATAVWRRFDGTNSVIQAATRPPGGSFGAAVDLSAAGQDAFDSKIAFAPDGTATVVWRQYSGTNWIIQAATRPPGGSFGAAVDLSTGGQGAYNPEIAIAPDGTATAVWYRFDGVTYIAQSASTTQPGSTGDPADVAITKTALSGKANPGDTVTYALKAKNVGTAPANDVDMTDSLPAGVTFVSADAPCVEAAATVTCEIGSLAPGEERTYEVKVTVDDWNNAKSNANHLLDVQKAETQIDLDAGEQRAVSATCPSGYFAADGSVRIDHIDQGTGDWTEPQVLESKASSLDTWRGTVKNTATGRAQAKAFAVCVRQQTGSEGGHSHRLTTTDQIYVKHVAPAGRDKTILECGPGQVAIQPGFATGAPGNMVYSQPKGNGWKFIYYSRVPSGIIYSIRCLDRTVPVADHHIHNLGLEHIWNTVTIQPGKVNEAQLTCEDGSKGIVGGFDLGYGLISLGNDPRPVTRAFKIYNPTDHALAAHLSLLCLGNRIGGEHALPRVIVNTANISTSSNEDVTDNNMDSATITAKDTDAFTPVPSLSTVKPTPNSSIATSIAQTARISKVSVNGPTKAKKGKKVTYQVRIKNSGNAVAKGVKLKVSGKGVKEKKSIGKIGPGKTKKVKVKLKPNKPGKIKTSFKVTSDNAGWKAVEKKIKVKK